MVIGGMGANDNERGMGSWEERVRTEVVDQIDCENFEAGYGLEGLGAEAYRDARRWAAGSVAV